MAYQGDLTLEQTLYFTFTTVDSTGAPATLSGTPVISCYENGSTTEITAGITLTVDLDGRTGFNLVAIAATTTNGYEAAKDYSAVITTGTVDSVSVVGYNVADFSIQNRHVDAVDALAAYDPPTKTEMDTAFTNLQTHGDSDWASQAALHSGTAQAGAAGTITLANGASSVAGFYDGTGIVLTAGTGIGQERVIVSTDVSTPTAVVATVDENWATNPASDTEYDIGPARAYVDSTAIQTAAAAALTAYDPPTKAELDTAVDALPTAAENAAALLAATVTVAAPADGSAPNVGQALSLIMGAMGVFKLTRTTTTLTAYANDETTVLATWTLDSATDPTSRTRAS